MFIWLGKYICLNTIIIEDTYIIYYNKLKRFLRIKKMNILIIFCCILQKYAYYKIVIKVLIKNVNEL